MRFGSLWISCFLFFIASGSFPASADKTVAPAIVLTAQENGLENQTTFLCYGKIHGYIRLPSRQYGEHVLESRWRLPAGPIAADSRTTMNLVPEASTTYIWFAFPERSNGLGSPDPALENDLLTFNGLWHLEVTWDDKPLPQSQFAVRCP
jgi:hypothetical protein